MLSGSIFDNLPEELTVSFVSPHLSNPAIGAILQTSKNSLRLFDSRESWAAKINQDFGISPQSLPASISCKTLYKHLWQLHASMPLEMEASKQDLNRKELLIAVCSNDIDYVLNLLPKLEIDTCLNFAIAAHSHHITDEFIPLLLTPITFHGYFSFACVTSNIPLIKKLIEIGRQRNYALSGSYYLDSILIPLSGRISDKVCLLIMEQIFATAEFNLENLFNLLSIAFRNRYEKTGIYLCEKLKEKDKEFLRTNADIFQGALFNRLKDVTLYLYPLKAEDKSFIPTLDLLHQAIKYGHSALFTLLLSLKDKAENQLLVPTKETLLTVLHFGDLSDLKILLPLLPAYVSLELDDINKAIEARNEINAEVVIRLLSHFKLTPDFPTFFAAESYNHVQLVEKLLVLRSEDGAKLFAPQPTTLRHTLNQGFNELAELFYNEIAENLSEDEIKELLNETVYCHSGIAIPLLMVAGQRGILKGDDIQNYFDLAVTYGQDNVGFYLLTNYRPNILVSAKLLCKAAAKYCQNSMRLMISILDARELRKLEATFLRLFGNVSLKLNPVQLELMVSYLKLSSTASPEIITKIIQCGSEQDCHFIIEKFKNEIIGFPRKSIEAMMGFAVESRKDQIALTLLKMRDRSSDLLFTPTEDFLQECLVKGRVKIVWYLINLKNQNNESYFDLNRIWQMERFPTLVCYKAFNKAMQLSDEGSGEYFFISYQASPQYFYQQVSDAINNGEFDLNLADKMLVELCEKFKDKLTKKICDSLREQIFVRTLFLSEENTVQNDDQQADNDDATKLKM